MFAVIDTPIVNRTLLAGYALDDSESPRSWIQVARTGDFVSSRYGKFSITQDDLRQMFQNFKNVTPKAPTRLAVDYDHLSMNPERPGDGKAAGWFVELELRDNDTTLWGQVEWTPDAAKAIKQKEYQFVSPTFIKNYRYKDGSVIGTTLLSAAITNHPFLEGMAALTLSARGEDVAIEQPEANTMSKLKVKTTEGNEVEIALDALSADALAAHPHVKALTEKANKTPEGSPDVKALSDKLASMEGTITSLKSDLTSEREKREAAEKRLSDERAQARVDELLRQGRIKADDDTKSFALDMARDDKQWERYIKTLPAKATVTTGREHGTGATGDDNDGDPEARMLSEVEAYERENKVSRKEAVREISLRNPSLARAARLKSSGTVIQ